MKRNVDDKFFEARKKNESLEFYRCNKIPDWQRISSNHLQLVPRQKIVINVFRRCQLVSVIISLNLDFNIQLHSMKTSTFGSCIVHNCLCIAANRSLLGLVIARNFPEKTCYFYVFEWWQAFMIPLTRVLLFIWSLIAGIGRKVVSFHCKHPSATGDKR